MRIGLLVPRSGPAGLWGPSCDAGTMLAAAELNAAGGVLGHPVELVVADPGWTEAEAASASADLVDLDEVQGVVAMHPSNVRAAVKRSLAGRAPYIYVAQYEGGERNRHTLATGATTGELLAPGIAWLARERGAKRFLLVGNDYVWPRAGHRTARELIRADGGEVVGEAVLPTGAPDCGAALETVRRLRPDVVVMFLLGMEAVSFNRAFAAEGLAFCTLRLGIALDETVLCAIGPEASEDLFTCSDYFSNLRSPENDRFLELYHDGFGALAPPMNASARSCYEGVHLLARLARLVGTRDAASLARDLGRLRRRRAGAEGRPVHVARAEGVEFRMVVPQTA